MKTIKQTLEDFCIQKGLWPDEAAAVVAEQYDELSEDLKSRWNHLASDYPASFIAVLFLDTENYALNYIDKNCPDHFARALFV